MKIFADSSILVKHVKGSKTNFIEACLEGSAVMHISSTVVSEFLFHSLAIRGNKSPLTIKMNGEISTYLDEKEVSTFLSQFSILSTNIEIVSAVPSLMVKYNLLSNDALILATCLHHSLPYLASYDENDFRGACAAEGITLISSVAEAEQYLTN